MCSSLVDVLREVDAELKEAAPLIFYEGRSPSPYAGERIYVTFLVVRAERAFLWLSGQRADTHE